jgi:hypothetical protein
MRPASHVAAPATEPVRRAGGSHRNQASRIAAPAAVLACPAAGRTVRQFAHFIDFARSNWDDPGLF